MRLLKAIFDTSVTVMDGELTKSSIKRIGKDIYNIRVV